MNEPPDTAPPVLRVVRGAHATPELAALVTVLLARARPTDDGAAGAAVRPQAEQPAGSWADRSRSLRRPLPHGTDRWRTGARP